MIKSFKDKDLGSRILLEFDPLKVDEHFYVSEPGYVKVPYDAIERYEVLVKVKKPKTSLIRDIGSALPKLNTIQIAKGLGASSVTIDGVIIELAETYVKIQESPRWHSLFR